MPGRGAAVLACGVTNAAKLLVASLAFTGAYAGVSAHDSAGTAPAPVTTVTLSARELPVTEPLPERPVAVSRSTAPSRASVAR
ncbi:hypothetical protein [Nonomuraea sp. NPDC050786]|uniref:hypothetical protein n=1 Tax=Nonomuraea sp. NPDC050786 TaxID=3154840 RepID=UPI0033F4B4C8